MAAPYERSPDRDPQRVLLTNHHLQVRAGSELVTLELAVELRRRGHAVAMFTHHRGALADELTDRFGIDVLTPLDRDRVAEWEPDALHVHHWPTLAYLRSAGVTAPATIGFLGTIPDLENPPPLDAGSVAPWWAVSESAQANVCATGAWASAPHRLVRNWFDPTICDPPDARSGSLRSLLVVSNHFPDDARMTLTAAARALAIDVSFIGLPDNPRPVTPALLEEFDALVTLGRTAVNGLALGIPVLLYDHFGADGWVTPAALASQAEHNFSGRAFGIQPTPEVLREWLASPPQQQDLDEVRRWAWQNCSFATAVDEIEQLLVQATHQAPPAEPAPWTRIVGGYVQELAYLNAERSRLTGALGQSEAELTSLTALLAETNRQLDEARLILDGMVGSTSWRLTAPLRWAAYAARGGARRR